MLIYVEKKTFMHYGNSEKVNLDTFNYIMQIANQQGGLYNQGEEFNKNIVNE